MRRTTKVVAGLVVLGVAARAATNPKVQQAVATSVNAGRRKAQNFLSNGSQPTNQREREQRYPQGGQL